MERRVRETPETVCDKHAVLTLQRDQIRDRRKGHEVDQLDQLVKTRATLTRHELSQPKRDPSAA